MNQEKHYIIKTQDDLSEWPEARALIKANSVNVAKFIYEDIIICHTCLIRIVMDEGSENKNIIIELLKRYKIA